MTAKKPWWQMTTSLRRAVFLGGAWMAVSISGVVSGIADHKVWSTVIWVLFLLCGLPWAITAVVLLRQRLRS
jgi:hypothetical protein